MRNNAFGFLVLTCTGLLVFGCGDSNSSPCEAGEVPCDGVCIPEIEPVLADIQASVFDVSCTFSSCHGTVNTQEMLEMSSAEISAANLIDVESEQVPGKNRVTPSDVPASYLFNKITGEDIAPATLRMPNGLIPLCDEKIMAVEAWIAAGAPE
jgi:hypothetical protein